MINCEWCGKSISQGYLNNTNKTICLECAEEDLYKMIELKDKLNTEITILAAGIRKLKTDLCPHENIIDTQYGKRLQTEWVNVYRCKDCGKEILK